MNAPAAVVCPVPPPEMAMVGRSEAAMARKEGLPLDPFGAAKNWLAVWLASVAVRVPELVTGEPVTENRLGKERPTLLTPPVGVPQLAFPLAATPVATWLPEHWVGAAASAVAVAALPVVF